MTRLGSLRMVAALFAVVLVVTIATLTALGIDSASDRRTPPPSSTMTVPAPPPIPTTLPTLPPLEP